METASQILSLLAASFSVWGAYLALLAATRNIRRDE
jgi:hypothetical protein